MTSTLLATHLEQISLCAASIAELPFPGPKIFTNALLAPHDITALIRDTEVHERALFSIAAPPLPAKGQPFSSSANGSFAGRTTTKQPKRNTAVAAVLGGDLYRRIRNAESGPEANPSYGRAMSKQKGDLDVDVLLEGAEKLCKVYPVAGAPEKISQLRERYQQLSQNIAHYEDRVARNSAQLGTLNQRKGYDSTSHQDHEDEEADIATPAPAQFMSQEDLEHEELEIRDLERKKKGLEERVTGMEKDLGGLMR